MIQDTAALLRKEFLLDESVIFLNHGSFGATPRVVFEAYQCWQRELERQPVEFLGRRFPELMANARADLGEYIHVGGNDLVFVPNATTGLNIVARSLPLQAGDEVVASNQEYGALDRTWRFLAQKSGFKYINIPQSRPDLIRQDWLTELWASVTPNTKVIFLSQVTSPTAKILPVEEVCYRARQAGILTVIDGAHAPGQLDLDLACLDCDFYSGNLHKWLCAPKGAAFIYAHPRVQHLIEPLVVSWGWQSEKPGPSPFVDYLEWTGTHDPSAFLSVPAAIQFQRTWKWEEVRASCTAMAARFLDAWKAVSNLPSLYPSESGWHAQMVALPLPSQTDPDHLKAWLYENKRIEIPISCHEQLPLARLSVQGYNSLADLQALMNSLCEYYGFSSLSL